MAKTFRIYMANQEGLRNERIFTASVYKTWTTGLSHLSTDIARMHRDAFYWFDQHVRDADINRRYRIMLKAYASFWRGDVTLGDIMRDF
jgi:hypothetical protein